MTGYKRYISVEPESYETKTFIIEIPRGEISAEIRETARVIRETCSDHRKEGRRFKLQSMEVNDLTRKLVYETWLA